MQIVVNKQKLDYTLDKEATIGEVVRGLQSWLNDSGFLISRLESDSLELSLENMDKWGEISIEKISSLDVTAETSCEARLNLLHYPLLKALQL